MTRLYLQGRTETVRSNTIEAKEFVLAFVDPAVPVDKKYKLLLKAAEVHAKKYKDCMNGKGIDRHLFALYVVCKGQGYVSIMTLKIFYLSSYHALPLHLLKLIHLAQYIV